MMYHFALNKYYIFYVHFCLLFQVLFALSDDVDIEFALGLIQACDEEASVTVNDQGICHIR